MPCPFPGMDPYLEMSPFWGDFSPKLLGAISYALLPQVLPRYDVRIEEYLVVTREEIRLHRLQPDVTISTSGTWQPAAEQHPAESAVAVAEPTMVELEYPDIEPRMQRRLRLIHRPTGRVVTVMELLSPINKAPGEDGLEAYLEMRAELLGSQCHLIELDLLRGGERLPMAGPLPKGDYYVYLGRSGRRPRGQIIAWPLRAPLPAISVPLLPDDPEVTLDLQAVFRAAYEPSLYDRRLPYEQPLLPPLRSEDEAWVQQRLLNIPAGSSTRSP
jgi:hypothetical protein